MWIFCFSIHIFLFVTYQNAMKECSIQSICLIKVKTTKFILKYFETLIREFWFSEIWITIRRHFKNVKPIVFKPLRLWVYELSIKLIFSYVCISLYFFLSIIECETGTSYELFKISGNTFSDSLNFFSLPWDS